MYQPINQVRLRGFLTESARLFVSRSGQPRITFRMEVWIDDENLPPKKPAGVDYFSVVAFGTEFVELAASVRHWNAKSRSRGGSAAAISIPTVAAS